MQIFQLFDGISGYACDIIKIGHHKVEFITGIQTKSVVGRSKKKRPIIGHHLQIAPNQDFSFETNIFNIHYIKYLPAPTNGPRGLIGKVHEANSAAQCGREFKSHIVQFYKIFFSLLEKRGGRTLKFLGCLTPQ